MSLTIKKSSGGNSTPAPAGTHIARCVRLIDLGTQVVEWKGAKKLQHKVSISWELPSELHVFSDEKGEEPFMVSGRYTANISSEKSGLRKILTSWRGRAFTDEEIMSFNLETIVGKACYLTVVHVPKKDGSGIYSNIMGAIALPKGIACPPQITPSLIFDLDNFTAETWNKLPEWTQSTIKLSPEWKAKAAQALPTTAELKKSPTHEEMLKAGWKPATGTVPPADPDPFADPDPTDDAGADPSDGEPIDDCPF